MPKSKWPKDRMQFIPALKEIIYNNVPLPKEEVDAALERWETFGEPRHPMEAGCFEVFAHFQQKVMETDQ